MTTVPHWEHMTPCEPGMDPNHHAAPTDPGHDCVLKLKGLPYSTTREQVREFFQEYKVKSIEFVSEPDGRPSGLGFVEFESKEEALKALSRNGEYIGERYVRLLHVPKSEMEEQVRLGTLAVPGAAAKLRSRLLRSQQARVAGYLAPQLLMPTALMAQPGAPVPRPLLAMQPPGTLMTPYGGANPHQQAPGTPQLPNWGSYTHPANVGIPLHQQFGSLSLGPQGGAPRPANAGFSLLSPAQQAAGMAGLQLQAQHMQQHATGNVANSQGMLALHSAAGTLQSSSSGSASQRTSSAGQLLDSTGGALAGLAASRMAHGMGQAQLGGMHGMAAMGHQFGHTGFQPHLGAATAAGISRGSVPLVQLQGGDAGFGMLGVNGSTLPALSSPGSPADDGSVPTSATVKMRGLPYRSNPGEILGFFAGFEYLPDSLQIGLDAAGRPSGEAWLTFTSPDEAGRAVRALNRRYLGTRYLELTCCAA